MRVRVRIPVVGSRQQGAVVSDLLGQRAQNGGALKRLVYHPFTICLGVICATGSAGYHCHRCPVGGDSTRAGRFAHAHTSMSRSARPNLEIRSMIAPMPYTRRPTGPNTDREDYVIRCETRDVGRVYRRQLPEGHRYYWTIYINGHVHQVPGVPISGLAVTLDEASAGRSMSR